MELSNLKKYKIPSTPGVYFFLGKNRKILYIGKATSLKQRVRSYFDADIKDKRSALIEKMVDDAIKIEWTETDSVLEAMLLETNLIRTQRPKYNTKSKDNKSFNHVVITKETYPRVLIVRGKDIVELGDGEYSAVYGPFPSGSLFKEALKILRKLFQFYDKDAPSDNKKYAQMSKVRKGKIDFNRQIGLYPHTFPVAVSKDSKRDTRSSRKGVRVYPEIQSPKEYARTIRHIKLFFEGKKKQIIKELEKEMKTHAKAEEFEKADVLKKKIFSLTHIQDVALIKDDVRMYADEKSIRIEAYDVAHLQGKDMVGVMIVCDARLNLEKNEYRKFLIKGYDSANDTGALTEILERRLGHEEWPLPDLIVVDGAVAQTNAATSVLKAKKLKIPVVGVVKDEKHNPKDLLGSKKHIDKYKDAILLANAESHRFAINYHRNKRRKSLLK